MKPIVYFLLLAVLLIGCEGNSGTINHKIKYTTSTTNLKASVADAPDRYTNLGTYITSITPRYFGARISVMMYQDQWQQEGSHMISYLEGHDNDPNFQSKIDVDFTGNEVNTYTPVLYGDKFDGLFRQKEVTFDYFYLVPDFFEQEFEIPAGYGNLTIIGQNGTYSTDPGTGKRYIKIYQHPLLEPVFGYPNQQPYAYFFGNTDRTYVVNKECLNLPSSEDLPGGGQHCIIRSSHFTPITVTMPDDGETIEMYSTISFDTQNLIQVYAGNDNTPYTVDDWFVFAPNFWERITVNLEVR